MTNMVDVISEYLLAPDNNFLSSVYNEASLQFELGAYLKKKFDFPYRADYERNVKFYPLPQVGSANANFTKKEMDIFVYHDAAPANGRFAIEVKYPRNGGVIGRMMNFTKDIKFMEEVKKTFGLNTYCLTIVSDCRYYDKSLNKTYSGAYPELVKFYRRDVINVKVGDNIVKSVVHPYGGKGKKIYGGMELQNSYDIVWNRLLDANGNPIVQTDGLKKEKEEADSAVKGVNGGKGICCYLIEI
ncbi:MAG: hypothetical protein LUD47_05105 [Clostridia bacterium]|nr:hypothetical protein [Clostridia bacterium]